MINPEQPASNTAVVRQHGVELVTISGVGHFLMMESPGRFNAVLSEVAQGILDE